MVAGEDAEPTRINGKALRKSELEREVSDREGRLSVHEPRMALVVLAICGPRALECLADLIPFAGTLDAVLTELREEQHGVLARRFPEFGVEGPEKSFHAGLPGPEQVVSELVEFFHHAEGLSSGPLAGALAPMRRQCLVASCAPSVTHPRDVRPRVLGG